MSYRMVGENGSGKTSILDATAAGLSPLLRYLSSANQRLSGFGIKDTDFRIESLPDRGSKQRWGTTDYAQIVIETTSGLEWDNWRRSSADKQQASKIGQTKVLNYAKVFLRVLKQTTLNCFTYFRLLRCPARQNRDTRAITAKQSGI